MAMNALGSEQVRPEGPGNGDTAGLLASAPKREIVKAVGVPGLPWMGKMELVRQGQGEAYFAKDSRGALYPLKAQFSDDGAIEEIRTMLRASGYTFAIDRSDPLGSLAVKPKADFSGIGKRAESNPFLAGTRPNSERSFLDSTYALSSPPPAKEFKLPGWAITPLSLPSQAVVEKRLHVVVNGWFSLLHAALVAFDRDPTKRDQFGHQLYAVKKNIEKLGWESRLTSAQAQALRNAERAFSPTMRVKGHTARLTEKRRDGKTYEFKAEVIVTEKLAHDGNFYVTEAKITRIYIDNRSDFLGGRQDRILRTAVDVSRGNGFHGHALGAPLRSINAVLEVARDQLREGGALRLWQGELPKDAKGRAKTILNQPPIAIATGTKAVATGLGKLAVDFLKGFVDLALLPLSGLGELVNVMALPVNNNHLLIPAAHQYANHFRQGLVELTDFVAAHGKDIPGLSVQAFMRELKSVDQMVGDGNLLGAIDKITYATATLVTALAGIKDLPKQGMKLLGGLKNGLAQAKLTVRALHKLPEEALNALKPGGSSFRLKKGGNTGKLTLDTAAVPRKSSPPTIPTRPVIPAVNAKTPTPPQSSRESVYPKESLAGTRSLNAPNPGQPAARSNPPIALPDGWRFRSELGVNGGKIELLDPRGLSKGVAFVNPRNDNPSIARLTGITIASDKRSQGLGKKLLQHIEQELAALGFRAIEANPLPGTKGSYTRAAYRRVEASFAGTWTKSLQAPQNTTRPTAPSVPQVPPDGTPDFNPASPGIATDTSLAGGVNRRANGQIVLRSSRLELILPPGFDFGPIAAFEHLGGVGKPAGYITISGHGSLSPQAVKAAGGRPLTTVPPGTRVVVLTPPGGSLGAGLGEHLDNRRFHINYGVDEPLQVPIRVPYRVLQPGKTLPNYVVTSPGTLNVPKRPDVITVTGTDGRPLSALLKPNMGTVVINICSTVEGTPRTRWSDLRFDTDRVTDLTNNSRVSYGLPSADDQTPPVGGVRAGAAGGKNDPDRARPRIDLGALPVPDPLPDGLSVKASSGGWSAANAHGMRAAVRANPGLFRGIHAMVDLINAEGPEELLIGRAVSVPAALNRGRPLRLEVVRRFEPGSQSEVLEIAVSSPADQQKDTFVLKVEHAELTALNRIRMRDGRWVGPVDFTTTFPDVVRLQELLKQDPDVRSFMQRHQIEFARWNFALDAGDARRPAGQPKRHYAILPLYKRVGPPTDGDKEVMKELSRMANSVLARTPSTRGIVLDLIGADNYLVVNEAGLRKLILVDPFTRPEPLQKSTLKRPQVARAPEFELPSAQAHAVDTFVVIFSRGRLNTGEREALYRWIVRDVATGGSAAAFRIGTDRAGQPQVQTVLSESGIVAGTRRRVRTP